MKTIGYIRVTIEAPLDLSLVSTDLLPQARASCAKGDISGVLLTLDSHKRLEFVHVNIQPLCRAELLEQAFFEAYIMGGIDWDIVFDILQACDPAKLQDMYPPPEILDSYQLYRGTGHPDMEKRETGASWTASREVARFFALRNATWENADPAIISITVPRECVYFYTNDRKEEEYFVDADWINENGGIEILERGIKKSCGLTEKPLCQPFGMGACFSFWWVPGGYRNRKSTYSFHRKCL